MLPQVPCSESVVSFETLFKGENYGTASLRWESVSCPLTDHGPLFASCTVWDPTLRELISVVSLSKNRFCELSSFSIDTYRWSPCTRTRHFRPPKRVGSAAVIAEGHLFIFGGYELSNHIGFNNYCNGAVASNGEKNQEHLDVHFEDSLIQLFGYPQWWLKELDYPELWTEPYEALGDALGDFHGYNTNRGDWKVIISRDNQKVMPLATTTTTTSGLSEADFDSRFSLSNKPLLSGIKLSKQCNKLRGNSNRQLARVATFHTEFPCPRAFHTLIRYGNMFILFGGERKNSLDNVSLEVKHFNDVWMFDLLQLRWILLFESSRSSYSRAAGLSGLGERSCDDSCFLTVSTTTSDEGCFSVDKFHREVDTEDELRSLTNSKKNFPWARSGHVAVIVGDTMIIYGGQDSELGLVFGDVWSFEISSKEWRLETTFGCNPGKRFGHTAISFGNGMFVYGGFKAEDVLMRRSFLASGSRNPMSIFSNWQFSDNNSLYYLDFKTMHWTSYPTTGYDPSPTRFFGRMEAFHWNKCLFFGGVSGLNNYDMYRIDITNLPFYSTAISSDLLDSNFKENIYVERIGKDKVGSRISRHLSNDCGYPLNLEYSRPDYTFKHQSEKKELGRFHHNNNHYHYPSHQIRYDQTMREGKNNFIRDFPPGINMDALGNESIRLDRQRGFNRNRFKNRIRADQLQSHFTKCNNYTMNTPQLNQGEALLSLEYTTTDSVLSENSNGISGTGVWPMSTSTIWPTNGNVASNFHELSLLTSEPLLFEKGDNFSVSSTLKGGSYEKFDNSSEEFPIPWQAKCDKSFESIRTSNGVVTKRKDKDKLENPTIYDKNEELVRPEIDNLLFSMPEFQQMYNEVQVLHAQIEKHKEENMVLKDAILLLLPDLQGDNFPLSETVKLKQTGNAVDQAGLATEHSTPVLKVLPGGQPATMRNK